MAGPYTGDPKDYAPKSRFSGALALITNKRAMDNLLLAHRFELEKQSLQDKNSMERTKEAGRLQIEAHKLSLEAQHKSDAEYKALNLAAGLMKDDDFVRKERRRWDQDQIEQFTLKNGRKPTKEEMAQFPKFDPTSYTQELAWQFYQQLLSMADRAKGGGAPSLASGGITPPEMNVPAQTPLPQPTTTPLQQSQSWPSSSQYGPYGSFSSGGASGASTTKKVGKYTLIL